MTYKKGRFTEVRSLDIMEADFVKGTWSLKKKGSASLLRIAASQG